MDAQMVGGLILTRHEQRYAEAQQRIADLEAELAIRDQAVSVLDESNRQLALKLAETSAAGEKWRQEYLWRYDRIVKQGERIESLQAEVARYTQRIESLEVVNAQLEIDLQSLRGVGSSDLVRQRNTAREESIKLQAQVEQREAEIERLQEIMRQTDAESLVELIHERDALGQKLESLQPWITLLEECPDEARAVIQERYAETQTALAFVKPWKERIAALEAEVAQQATVLDLAQQALTQAQMQVGRLEGALVLAREKHAMIADLEKRLAGCSQVIQFREHTIDVLIEEAKRRQPCAHEPPGSDPDCAWCRVREEFIRRIGTWATLAHSVRIFDAAVQAVREG